MDDTLHVHGRSVAVAATGKGAADSKTPNGMSIYVPHQDYTSPPIHPRSDARAHAHGGAIGVAATTPPRHPGSAVGVHGAVAVAARGKEDCYFVSPGTGDTRITRGMPTFVPPQQDKARPRDNNPRLSPSPAAAADAYEITATRASDDAVVDNGRNTARRAIENDLPQPRYREASPSRFAFAVSPAYQRPTASVSTGFDSSDDATTDDSEEDLPAVAVGRRREGEANASWPVSEAGGQSPAEHATDDPTGLEAHPMEGRPANPSKSIPTAVDARPRPSAPATPAPGGNGGTTPSKNNQRGEATTFCERLLSCFGLCSSDGSSSQS